MEALSFIFFCCTLASMRCLSCQVETPATGMKIFNKILLCPSCYALAEKAETDIDRCFERAKMMTKNWLSQHILRGGLLLGGDGRGREAADGTDGLCRGTENAAKRHRPSVQQLLHEAALSSMRNAARGNDGGQPNIHPRDEAEANTRG